MFNFSGPGPGGVIADFGLWLKGTRGIEKDGSNKVSVWNDLGPNPKDAIQPTAINQPTFIDTYTGNINFNPVVKFLNGGGTEEYLYNITNGFYSQDIFIVMIPDATITSLSSQNTIFGGVKSNLDNPTPAGTITGVGYGNYTTGFINELLSYMQESTSTYGIAEISTTKSYGNAGIINVRNNSTIANSQEMLYNSNLLTTSTNVGTFTNVGHIDTVPDPDVVWGTKYWIGKNFSESGSLNGRVAEILTFAERVPDDDGIQPDNSDNSRQKIETYLAIKYGITLGSSTEAQKDYVNSAGIKIWDIAANTGFNFNIAGIGRDDDSDLNQKQSKSINDVNEVIIGLGAIAPTNSVNTNEFKVNKEFLVWGCDNGAFTGTSTNAVTIGTGATTTLTRIDRIWKIVGTGADVSEVYIGIPTTAFSSFAKNANEEYALIVSNTPSFLDTDIIDVIPLKSNSNILGILQTWYDFEGTKFFTFGKVPKLTEKSAVNIGLTDFLVGEYSLNLNPFAFTVSAWVKGNNTASIRTIMAKGSKLQLRLNAAHKIEVMVDDDATPRFTSNMILNDLKWHHIAFVYQSGTIFLYVDGVLDQSAQGVNPPTPNFNRFSIGAVYIDAHTIDSPFLGGIDEVYVWNLALTGDQVNFLMNQEIEQNGALVRGKVIPKDIPSMPWAYLAAYYDFNSFYGTTVEGQTNDRFFLRINYRAVAKTIVSTQTAPLPYITKANGDWNIAGTWLNNTVQNIPNSISLKAGTDVEGNIVQIAHNVASTSNKVVLGLLVDSFKTVSSSNDTKIQVSHYLKLDGIIDLQGKSQLIQTLDSELEPTSSGYIIRSQQGTGNKYSYNYWSSPVGPINAVTNNNNYTISGVFKDGTTLTPQNITWIGGYDGNSGTSPISLARYWLYKFVNGTAYANWAKITENSPLVPSQAFTVKGASGVGSTSQNYTFVGKPYNGTIETNSILANNYFLVGNPYPSALDGYTFIEDNASSITGSIYFWEQSALNNTHLLKGYTGGYSILNLTGGVPPVSPPEISGLGAITKIPKQYIPVGQGFFVIGESVNGGIITFNNGQRGFQKEDSAESNTLFKNAETSGRKSFSTNSDDSITSDNYFKIRLGFNTSSKFHRQMLIGFMNEKATDSLDYGYDAQQIDTQESDAYFVIGTSKYNIQGVGKFDVNKVYPLGVKVSVDGIVQFIIDGTDNLPPNIDINIFDKETGNTFVINNQPFEITLMAGEYLKRFALTFKSNAPIAIEETAVIDEEEVIIDEVQVFMNNITSVLHVKNDDTEGIKNILLINYLGQNIGSWKINSNERELAIPIKQATGVYIVQVSSKIGKLNKKIIIK
ncbi:LamG-like jellyroll fold domain-containing protein [Lutibacter sp.]|uniref:LamG-like jellyroll fold domain-containing protein n=1 Tax=Lutibacter sp. TaxID=1925666 RepID=UPI00273650F7|nr:LamG-like jellyroll fold domain-containing protein [Lutibacter sp.]MDP3313919.1 LamG-like jellyroll fold domain-containing protein [Lutibacter sp.]